MEKTQPICLVLAHSYHLIRDGLRRWLESEPNHKVIGEASDGTEAVKLARQLKPDILLLELRMPKHSGSPKRWGLQALGELIDTPLPKGRGGRACVLTIGKGVA